MGRNISTTTSTTKATTSFHLPPNSAGAVVLDQAEQQAAERARPEVADAAEDGGGERLDAEQEADVEPRDLEVDHVEHAAPPAMMPPSRNVSMMTRSS